jgi:hypothetical protein
MDREWRDTQPTVASAAVTQLAEREQQSEPRDWRQRRREAAQERQRSFEAQVESGELIVRRASGAELDQLRAEAARYRARHPEDAEKAAKLRRSRPVVQPKPRQPRTCAFEDCGQEFAPSKAQKYCSSICANRAAWKLRKARAAA